VPFALGGLAQVDQRHVGRRRAASRRVAVTDHPRRSIASCASPTFMLAGTATSIIPGLGKWRLFMRSIYSSTDVTRGAGEGLFLADGRDGVAFVVVCGEEPGVSSGSRSSLPNATRIVGAGRRFWKSVAGAADQQRVAGEHAIAMTKL